MTTPTITFSIFHHFSKESLYFRWVMKARFKRIIQLKIGYDQLFSERRGKWWWGWSNTSLEHAFNLPCESFHHSFILPYESFHLIQFFFFVPYEGFHRAFILPCFHRVSFINFWLFLNSCSSSSSSSFINCDYSSI